MRPSTVFQLFLPHHPHLILHFFLFIAIWTANATTQMGLCWRMKKHWFKRRRKKAEKIFIKSSHVACLSEDDDDDEKIILLNEQIVTWYFICRRCLFLSLVCCCCIWRNWALKLLLDNRRNNFYLSDINHHQ